MQLKQNENFKSSCCRNVRVIQSAKEVGYNQFPVYFFKTTQLGQERRSNAGSYGESAGAAVSIFR